MFGTLSEWLFNSEGLTAHGFCLLWEPGLIWTYAVSDTVIGFAYFTIPLALAVIARRRRDLVFRPVLWLFAAFIVLCGTTHWLDLLTLWVPVYGLQGVVKAATAVVSLFTALALWRILPQVLAFPSPAQYRAAHEALLASREQLGQAQKMEAVGQLTGGIAHDFNNILQAITGALTMLERRIAQGRIEETVRYVGAMRKAAESAAALTSRLLAFSRRQTLQPRLIEPAALVRGMRDLLSRTLGPHIALDLDVDKARWQAVCDPNQLESALLNLAINARDAMPGGGSLTIAAADRVLGSADLARPDLARPDAAPGRYVALSVRDTGTGMTPDVLARVFEPFFTTKPTGRGSGLGLSQVHGFVYQSGGFVGLESVPGAGTTVTLFLRAEAEAAPAPPPPPAAPAAEMQPARGTILVVDDQDDVREQIAEALAESGYRVLQAADGPAGLQAVRADGALDCLVTDVGLPGLNGRQLAEAARALRPSMPVLLITGYAGTALEDLAPGAGFEILRKPFPLGDLTARVRQLMEGAEAVG